MATISPTTEPTPASLMAQLQQAQNALNAKTGLNTKLPNTPSVIPTKAIGTTPVKIPTIPAQTPKIPTAVPPPQGTTADANGNATANPPVETPTQTTYQKMLEKIGGLGEQLAGKADAEVKLQKELQLKQKTEQATRDYNAYIQARLVHDQTVERMKTENKEGQFGGAHQADIAVYERKSNANLANLAVIAQMSQGLESAARQTIKDSIEAQFQPIRDQIDFYTKFAELNQNDLTESEQFKLQEMSNQKKTDAANVQNVANQLGQAFLGDPTALSAINKVIADYTEGKITAQQATAQMYSSVGVPIDVQLDRQLQQAQIANIGSGSGSGGGGGGGGVLLTPEQQSDPFVQKLLNSSGGKGVTGTPLDRIEKARTVLSQLGSLQASIQQTDTGPIVGAFKGANPWDTNAQVIKAKLNAIIPNLARGIYGEVGVLTDNDIKNYKGTLGNLTSTEDVNNALLYITIDLVGRSIKNTLEVQAAGGRDVSGFVDIYTDMEATKSGLLSQFSSNVETTKEDEDLFDSVTGGTSGGGGFFSDIWSGFTGLFK